MSSRTVALTVLRRVEADDAWANLILPTELNRANLEPRDAAFATELTYGTLRRLGSIDWVLSTFIDRPLDLVEPEVRDALRLGTYQLVFAGIAAHAAVSETVDALGPHRARGYVNAVLRKIARTEIAWPDRQADLVTHLQIAQCHPRWIADLVVREMGSKQAEAFLASNNVAPPVSLRATANPQDLIEALRSGGLDAVAGQWAPDAVIVTGGGRPGALPGFARGDFAIMDESSILAAKALEASDGQTVVDLCAGPGGKTGVLAAATGSTIAIEPAAHRAGLIRQTLERLKLQALVLQADGLKPPIVGGVDGVLVDAPCSGLGVLRRRPEARWRLKPELVSQLPALQTRLLESAWQMIGPGGSVVYSVCTVTASETVDVIERFQAEHSDAEAITVHPSIPRPDFRRGPYLQLTPNLHGTDGMFIASFRRLS